MPLIFNHRFIGFIGFFFCQYRRFFSDFTDVTDLLFRITKFGCFRRDAFAFSSSLQTSMRIQFFISYSHANFLNTNFCLQTMLLCYQVCFYIYIIYIILFASYKFFHNVKTTNVFQKMYH